MAEGEAVAHVENATRSFVDRGREEDLSKDPLEFEIIGSVFIEPCSHFLVDEDGSGASLAVSETSRNTSMLVNIDWPGRLKYHDPR